MAAAQHAHVAGIFEAAHVFLTGRDQTRAACRQALPIVLLGVPFDNVVMDEAVRQIESMIASLEPHHVATANVDFLVQARSDVELRRILVEAHLVLCDGTPLVWASHLLGNPLPERVAGSDLVPLLIQTAAQKNYRLFFLGASPEANAQAVARLKARYPTLQVAGHYSPPFKPLLEMDHEEIKRRIQTARPDLLFVAFGCPKQEKWIAMHYRSLGVPVTIGVGATIDFLAGRLRRAPVWMQRTGAEWIFRLLQEPRRLVGRYVNDLWHFSRAMLAQAWHMQWRPHNRQNECVGPPVMIESTWIRVVAPACFDRSSIENNAIAWDRITDGTRHCLLELTDVKFIDSTGVALLLSLRKQLRESGRHLILLAPGPAVNGALALMRLENFFETARDALEAREMIKARDRERAAHVINGAKSPLVWQGEITAVNAEEVWLQTRAEINATSSWRKQWRIDLSHVRFIDSSGVEVMVRARKYAPRHGVKVHFVGLPPVVRNVLRQSRLKELLWSDAP